MVNLAFLMLLWYYIATFEGEIGMDMIFVLLMIALHVLFLIIREICELVIDYRKF